MQKKLEDFYLHEKKVFTSTASSILELLAQGYSGSQVARKLEISKQRVQYHLKRLEKAGLIEKQGRSSVCFWKVKNSALGVVVGKSVVLAPDPSVPPVGGARRFSSRHSASRGFYAGSGGSLGSGGEPVRLALPMGRSSGVSPASTPLISGSPPGVWLAHHVRGSAGIRREGDWTAVRRLAHRINRITPNQFIFYFNDCTLTLRRKSVQVEVFGLKSQDEKRLFGEASGKARVVLADFMREFGFQFGEFEWRRPVHWVLSKELSRDFLRFKPDLADGSHPEQVEVYTSEAQGAITDLISGSLLERLSSLIKRQEELELVVKAQAVALSKIVSILEHGFE